MNSIHNTGKKLVALASGLACLSTAAFAQSLAVTNGTTITYTGDTVPDKTGVDLPGYAFGGTGSFDTPSLDDAGNLFFRGQMQEASLTPINDRAYFYGSTRANLKMVVQGGDPEPSGTLPVGTLLRTATGSSSALQSSAIRVGPSGILWWGSNTYDGTNSGNYLFGGPFGTQSVFEFQGDAAPFTSETFAQTFQGLSQQSSGLNRNGHIYFNATLSGPTTQRIGIWAGLPGALQLVQRMGTPLAAIPGTEIVDTGTPFGFTVQINEANQVLWEAKLSLVNGGTPATTLNDQVYLIYTPGSGSNVIVRESDTFLPNGFTFNSLAGGTTWTIGTSANCFTRSGKTFFFSDLVGGDVSGTTNDRAGFIYNYNSGTPSLNMVIRKGDPAPCTDTTWASWNNTSSGMNDKGQILVQGNLTVGGTTTAANDTGFWAGYPNSLQLVVREGQVMPGTGGSICGSLGGVSSSFNEQGRVMFTCSMTGGTITGSAYWVWDPNSGLTPLLLPNDVIEVAPTVFKTMTGSISTNTANNGDGQALRFGPNGYIGFKASISAGSGGGNAMMTVFLPPNPIATPFCLGDGTQGTCPCGNNGQLGNGCASAAFQAGGHLSTGGVPSIGSDTLRLDASNIPGPGVFIQANPAAGFAILGDGILCATSGIIRLGVVFPTDGCMSYPGGTTPNPISVQGLVANGNTKLYQCWYRTIPSVCSTGNFNLTQGQQVTWGP